MRRKVFQTLLVAAVCGTGAGCTTGGEPIIILQNQVPGENCIISSTQSDSFFPRGVIDTNTTAGYLFTPVVQNNAATVPDQNLNQRIVNVSGAEIHIEVQNGVFEAGELDALREQNLLDFTKRFSGSIQPDGGTTSFSFIIVPTGLIEAIGAKLGDSSQRVEVRSEVTIFGSMGGGGVESIPFTYPVDVCKDCLQVSVGDCADLDESFEPLTGGVCNPLQDGITECCNDASGALICPAVPPSPTQ